MARSFALMMLVCAGYAMVTAYPVLAQGQVSHDTVGHAHQGQTTTRLLRDTTVQVQHDTVGQAHQGQTPRLLRDTTVHIQRDTTPADTAPVDTLRIDTLAHDTLHIDSARADSLRRHLTRGTPAAHPQPDSLRPDSIQARIGRDEAPIALEAGESYTWTRDELYASGSLTLLDLLRRIPGITAFQTLWLPSPKFAAYNGDFGRVRVFYDGIELDNLESRNGSLLDLNTIPLWTLEHVSVIRGANELRIDVRSWEYNKTRPYTRVDVLTGDYNTNLYRAFYGKRFYNGAGLQLAAQRYGSSDDRYGGGGDDLSLMGRYGIAHKWWSLDATALRSRNTRAITQRFDGGIAMPNYQASNTIAYIRAAIGHEGQGPFVQLVASSLGLRESSSHFDTASAARYGFPPDLTDSLSSLSQYVATAGFDKWGGRVRLVDRYRTQRGAGYNSLGATFDFSRPLLSVSGSAERDNYYGFTRVEAGARFAPVDFLAISGYVGQRNADESRNGQPDSRSARLEGGIRILRKGLWLLGGIMTRDTTLLIAPVVFDSSFRTRSIGATTGATLALRGPLKYGFSIDAWGVAWNQPNAYTPKYQARGELRFFSEWLSKFPNGNFSFLFAPYFEYRGKVAFPTTGADYTAASSTVASLLVELRILRGVITFERRNLSTTLYEEVPGYLMPRAVTLYGARWYFFN